MIRPALPVFLLLITVLLSACGGGGGGGSSSDSDNKGVSGSNEPPPASQEPPPPAITLVNDASQVEKAAIQIIETGDIHLDEESYTGEVNGMEVSLFRIDNGSLGFLLPPDFPDGAHRLTVHIDGKSWDIDFEAKAPPVAPRVDSLNSLDAHFAELRLALQEVIDTLRTDGAPQDDINELIAYQTTLDTRDPRYADLSDAELDYLNRFLLNTLALLETDAAIGSSPVNALSLAPKTQLTGMGMSSQHAMRFNVMPTSGLFDGFPSKCESTLKRYGKRLTGTVVLIGLAGHGVATASWFGTTPAGLATGAIVGAIGGAVLINKFYGVAEDWEKTWDSCVNPSIDDIQEEIGVNTLAMPKMHSMGMAKTTITNESDKELSFEVEIPVQYTLQTEFDIIDAFKESFPRIRSVVSKLSLFLPAALEEKILTRTASDYREPVPAAMIAIEQISEANIDGKVVIVDEDSFKLSFSAPYSLGEQVLPFTFVLYNQKNEIKTRYQANLTIQSHCPYVYSDEVQVINQADRCIVINADLDTVRYAEYWQQTLELSEEYKSGGSSLKDVKGLLAYTDIDDHYVDAEPVKRESFNIIQLVDGRHTSVLAWSEERCASCEDADEIIIEYSDPLWSDGGYWVSVKQREDYYLDGTLREEVTYFPPFQDTSRNNYWITYGWYSQLSGRTEYYPDGALKREDTYFPPFQDNNGKWISRGSEGWGPISNWNSDHGQRKTITAYYPDGTLEQEVAYFPPYQDRYGNWYSDPSEDIRYHSTGELAGQFDYTFTGTGTALSWGWSNDSTDWLEGETIFSEPFELPNGRWTSVPSKTTTVQKTVYPDYFITYITTYSEPLLNGYGDWDSVEAKQLIYSREKAQESPGNLRVKAIYSEPLQYYLWSGNDGDMRWTSLPVEETEYEKDGSRRQKITYDLYQFEGSEEGTTRWRNTVTRVDSYWANCYSTYIGAGSVNTCPVDYHPQAYGRPVRNFER